MSLDLDRIKYIHQNRDFAIYHDFDAYINSKDFEQYMQDMLESCAYKYQDSVYIDLFAYVDNESGNIGIMVNRDKPYKWYKTFNFEDFNNIFNEKCIDKFTDCLEEWMRQNKLPFYLVRKKLSIFDDEKINQLKKGVPKAQLGLGICIEYVISIYEIN